MASDAVLGALGGLGDSLQFIGKSLFADKLEKDREARAEQRQLAKETREDQRVRATPDAAQTSYLERDGALFKQTKNKYGDVLDEQLASPDEIDTRNYNKKKQQQDLDSGEALLQSRGLAAELSQKKLDDYDSDKSLERQLMQARIGAQNANASADYARGRSYDSKTSGKSGTQDSDETPESFDLAKMLVDENKQLQSQYEDIGYDQMLRIANSSIKEARKQGKQPLNVYINALQEYSNASATK